jgi:hypothetical protein
MGISSLVKSSQDNSRALLGEDGHEMHGLVEQVLLRSALEGRGEVLDDGLLVHRTLTRVEELVVRADASCELTVEAVPAQVDLPRGTLDGIG